MLEFKDIILGEFGTPRCSRCHRVEAERLTDGAAIVSAIRDAVSEWPGGPGPNLAFVGAEPFGHPALFELIDAAMQAGVSRLRLETDAHALVTAATVERVLQSGVRQLTVSLLGHTPGLHDSLSGRPGSFAGTVAGVESFVDVANKLAARTHVIARIPVCQHNLRVTPEIVTLAAKSGANAVVLCVDDSDLDVRQAGPWLEAACDSGIVYTTWVTVEGVPYGCARGWELHLASIYHKVEGEKSEVCRECPLTDVCGGAMPGASERVTATFATPSDAVRLSQRVVRSYESPEIS